MLYFACFWWSEYWLVQVFPWQAFTWWLWYSCRTSRVQGKLKTKFMFLNEINWNESKTWKRTKSHVNCKKKKTSVNFRKSDCLQILRMEQLCRWQCFVEAPRSVFTSIIHSLPFSIFFFSILVITYFSYHFFLLCHRCSVRLDQILFWFVNLHAMVHEIIAQPCWDLSLVVFHA